MNNKVELSENQKKAVELKDEAIYVKASAGSGKTRVLTERIRYLLSQTDKKILALTFTNKAGEEIKERLKDIENINEKTFIGTFHSFCQNILENRIHLLGYEKMPHIFENENDRLELIEESIKQIPSFYSEYENKDKRKQKNKLYQVLNFISEVKRMLITDIENYAEEEDTILLYREYQEILRSQNAIDYDDLLLLAYQIFVDFPKIASLYCRSFFAVCIDEAQDLNNAQYQFLKVLTNDKLKNVMMVGDPNQAIFHFNGASPNYMDKEFVKDFNPIIIELTENYRSSKKVLSAANQIIPNNESIERIAKEGIFELYEMANEFSEAEWVTKKIKNIISLKNHKEIEGEINYEKIVVLARNKYLFKPLEKEFDSLNLPYYYKMTPGALKFESVIMKIFDLALKVKLNPLDNLHRIRLLKLLKINPNNTNELCKIIDKIKVNEEKKILKLVESLNDDGSNFVKNINDFKNQISDFELEDNEKKMIFNDIDELLKHWNIYAKKIDNKSLHQFKNSMALGKTHPMTEHQGITLSTIHTMKGQEFDIVFIIGMDDETFPDYRAVKSGGVELKQEKNNLYVAFTRAKRWLYVTYPYERTMPWGAQKARKISRFLENIVFDINNEE